MTNPKTISLLDIAPSTATVEVQPGKHVNVFGVSAEGIAALFVDFPALQKIFAGEKMERPPFAELVKTVPEALAAVIAAGTGTPGNKDAITAARRLPVQTQLELLDKIAELTMPQGFGPFVDALNAFVSKMDFDGQNMAPVTKSPSPSNS